MTYKIVRKYQKEGKADKFIDGGLTLEEVKEHCSDSESSSRTCSSEEGLAHTTKHGSWFDAWYEE